MIKQKISILLLLALVWSGNSDPAADSKSEPDAVTESETATDSEWIYLFDGTSTEGWRAYNGDALPPGWIAKNGQLTFDTELGLEQDYKGGKDISLALKSSTISNFIWNGNFPKVAIAVFFII